MTQKHTVQSFIFDSAKPFKLYLGLHFFVVVYNAIDVSLWPYVSKLLVDKIAVTPRAEVIHACFPLVALLVFLTILPGFIWRIGDYSWMKLTPRLKKKITVEAMDYLMQHSHSFFQNNFSGSLANKVRDLANCSHQILDRALYSFLNVILVVIIAFFALFSIHSFFAFALLVWASLFIFIAIKGAKKATALWLPAADQQTKITGNLVDVLGNVANTRLFSAHTFEGRRVSALQDEYTRFSERRNWFLLKFFTIHGLTFSCYFAICISALVWLYSVGEVTMGDFVMILPLNCFIIHQMWMAAQEMRGFLEDVGTMNQALSIMNEPLKIKDAEDAKDLKISANNPPEIIFENVRFAYDKNIAPLFAEKSLVIKSGEKVGLVGHSGAGKSTLVSLLLRLYDLDFGKIFIDGQDISRVTQNSLRDAIALIPQDPSLFHRTLRENIAYGHSGIAELQLGIAYDPVITAAIKAHANEFIAQLPHGYDSLVGERGVKLSGGQRQRIAIARAFLKNAPILVLDEATSQLDSLTEDVIQESLRKLMRNKTSIVIAHRLSTLKMMDRILVFDRGKIVEEGSHQELLDLNGVYKNFWEAQVGGFIA